MSYRQFLLLICGVKPENACILHISLLNILLINIILILFTWETITFRPIKAQTLHFMYKLQIRAKKLWANYSNAIAMKLSSSSKLSTSIMSSSPSTGRSSELSKTLPCTCCNKAEEIKTIWTMALLKWIQVNIKIPDSFGSLLRQWEAFDTVLFPQDIEPWTSPLQGLFVAVLPFAFFLPLNNHNHHLQKDSFVRLVLPVCWMPCWGHQDGTLVVQSLSVSTAELLSPIFPQTIQQFYIVFEPGDL